MLQEANITHADSLVDSLSRAHSVIHHIPVSRHLGEEASRWCQSLIIHIFPDRDPHDMVQRQAIWITVTWDHDCSHEIKRFLLLVRKTMTNLDSMLKTRDHFADKSPYSQSYVFTRSHVPMWELDQKEGWVLKNWCLQIGEDSWMSLGLQEDQTSQTSRK